MVAMMFKSVEETTKELIKELIRKVEILS